MSNRYKQIKNSPFHQWTEYINRFIDNAKEQPIMVDNSIKLNEKINYIARLIVEGDINESEPTPFFKIRYTNQFDEDKRGKNFYRSLSVFNPFLNLWIPYYEIADYFIFLFTGSGQVEKINSKLATEIASLLGAKNFSTTIPPMYTGTRYQLFVNGIYDFKEDKFMKSGTFNELEDEYGNMKKVEDFGFTHRHLHNIEFCDNPEEPVFLNSLTNQYWDFREWLLKINHNEKDRANFLLFIIGMCLLPATNIGVNFIVKGDSGSGKSTIGQLIKNCYVGDSSGIEKIYNTYVEKSVNTSFSASTLKEQFPFRGTLDKQVNFIHLSEANGTHLNEQASEYYDKFADETVESKQLRGDSLVLSPSPTLYVEGTKWMKFDSVKNGVERRTVPFKIEPTDDLNDYYIETIDKDKLFADKKILQWLVKESFKEVRKYFSDYNDMRIKAQTFKFPYFITEWKNELISGGDESQNFYKTVIDYSIKDISSEGKYINFKMLHDIYNTYEDMQGNQFKKQRSSFNEAMIFAFKNHGFIIQEQKIMSVENTDDLAIDLGKVNQIVSMDSAITLAGYEDGEFANKLKSDWIKIIPDKKEDKQEDDEELSDEVEDLDSIFGL